MSKRNTRVLLGCTLVTYATDVFDVERNGWPMGMICKAKKNDKWAATWNMIPNEGDSAYKYETIEAAVQRLIDWERETK